jgi:hypothetical protein
MPPRTKAPERLAQPPIEKEPPGALRDSPPWTTEERLQRIRALGQRIDKYVEDMCAVGTLNGTSAEAKDKAVAVFYERMVVLERQLGHIREELHLG